MSSRVGRTYFCRVCGNEVEFKKDGNGKLVCCGHEMEIKKEGYSQEE